MPKKTPFLNSFNSGELAPRIDTRFDVDVYSKGCKTLKNMLPTASGKVTRVPGTKFVAEAIGNSYDPYLIGWYKFNEGSGDIVNNYAGDGSLGGGLLPNLDVGNYDGKFWTYLPGFASSPWFGSCNYARLILDVARDYGPAMGWGIFYRPAIQEPQTYAIVHGSLTNVGNLSGWGSIYECSGQHWVDAFWNFAIAGAFPTPLLAWCFTFQNGTKTYLVKADGTLQSANFVQVASVVFKQLLVGAFFTWKEGEGGSGANGSYADLIIYDNANPSLWTWAWWYDQLRTRYGMAARSGW